MEGVTSSNWAVTWEQVDRTSRKGPEWFEVIEDNDQTLLVLVGPEDEEEWPLEDGNDARNAQTERHVLDLAYEQKELNPESMVFIGIERT